MNNGPNLQAIAEALKNSMSSPERVLGSLGLLAKRQQRQARGFLICCPWHHERTPSCSVQVKGGVLVAHCFACEAGGSVLDMVAAVYGLDIKRDFREVLRATAEIGGQWDVLDELDGRQGGEPRPRPAPRPAPPREPEPERPAPLAAERFAELACAILDAAPVRSQPDVWRYLEGRGLAELAEADGWGALPEPKAQGPLLDELVRRFGLDVLARSGVLMLSRQGGASVVRGGHPVLVWPEHRLVIPWRGPDGAVLTLQRRLMRTPRDGEPKYVFPSGRRPGWPYGAEAIQWAQVGDAVAFVEGAPDVLAFRRMAHVRQMPRVLVLGLPGVKGWRPEWPKLACGRLALVALDADKAGDDARDFIGALWRAGSKDVRRLRPRKGKDWGEEIETEVKP